MKKGHKYAQDITGQKFGKLTAIKIDNVKRYGNTTETHWLCKCECGNITSVEASRLKRGYTKSCGCLRKEHRKSDSIRNGRLYRIWIGIKARCYNPNANTYKDYGGRGISVCEEWKGNYEAFRDWAYSNGYSENLSIDRIDADGNYEPSNCRWTTQKVQSNNTRKNIIIEYKGESHTFSEWMDILELNYSVIYGRIYTLGWSVEKAFETPIRNRITKTKQKGK